MQKNSEKKVKKPYQKPAVIYAKKIEVIAAVCGSDRDGSGSGICRDPASACIRLYT